MSENAILVPQHQIERAQVNRIDAKEKIRGSIKYVTDMVEIDALYVKVVRSSSPHAIINSIETQLAKDVEGVLMVLTASDIPGSNLVGEDQPLLAMEKVRYVGEPVALIVATDAVAARKAAELVKVNYKPLPSIFNIEDAMRPGATLIHERGNIKSRFFIKAGDTESAFKSCDVIVEGTYTTPYQDHAFIETEAALAIPNGDEMTVIVGTQLPFVVQKNIKRILGDRVHAVQVIQSPTGGAFGGKEETTTIVAGQAALSALLTGKPCLLALNRKESMLQQSKRHPARIIRKLGASKEGKILALQEDILLDGGAYLLTSPAVLVQAVVTGAGPYMIPNLLISGTAVYTNKIPSGAFRAFGRPQVIFAGEQQIDELANKLNMDPIELRLKNIIDKGQKFSWGQGATSSVGLRQCLIEVAKMSDWEHKRVKFREEGVINGIARGVGVALTMHGTGLWPLGRDIGSALLELADDGRIKVKVALSEFGQGSQSGWVEIVSKALNINPELIDVLYPDTSNMYDSGPTVASRSTLFGGRALYEASLNLKSTLLRLASRLMNAQPTSLLIDGNFIVDLQTGYKIDFKQLVDYAQSVGIKVIGEAFINLKEGTSWNLESGQGSLFNSISYAAHIAEVEVNVNTGRVRVKNYYAAHDSGKILNYKRAESQVYGGIIQGLGYALTEDLAYRDGVLLTNSFLDYMVPTFADAPDTHVKFIETNDENGPFGAKGLAEVPFEPVAGAIACAIYGATGKTIDSFPFTGERILKVIE